MNDFDFSFLYEKKKKKESELIPLYQELEIPNRQPPKVEDEETGVIIIEL